MSFATEDMEWPKGIDDDKTSDDEIGNDDKKSFRDSYFVN